MAISFAAAAMVATFAGYQYRRGAAFTVKYGWRTRAEHPSEFWWGIGTTAFVALMFAAPGISAALKL